MLKTRTQIKSVLQQGDKPGRLYLVIKPTVTVRGRNYRQGIGTLRQQPRQLYKIRKQTKKHKKKTCVNKKRVCTAKKKKI